MRSPSPLIAMVMAASGCVGLASQPETPAFLVASAATRATLQLAVNQTLGFPTTLAADALTSSSSLSIERTPARDSQGRLLNGRETGRPERFQLVKSDMRCVLIHEGSGTRIVLKDVRCRPAS